MAWIFYLLTSLTNKVVKRLYFKDYKISIVISASDLYTFFFFLKKNSLCQYKALVDICVSDFPEKKNRFIIAYSLLSYCYNNRINLEINNSEVQGAFSLSNLYNSANWAEREVWDMFGIIFYWHTDLRRILTDYGFSGFPLRKDFPMSGFIEVLYSQKQKRLLYNRVVLAQEYRNFSFEHFTTFWASQKFVLRKKILIKVHTIKVHKGSFRYNGFDAGVSVENNGVGVLFLDTYKYKSVDGIISGVQSWPDLTPEGLTQFSIYIYDAWKKLAG